MEIKEFNLEDLQMESEFLRTLESENGFDNPYYGMTEEQFTADGVLNIQNEAAGIDLKEGYVPQTLFFLWDKETIVGIFKVRHKLNEKLLTGAGHIGYAIKKEYRRQGYATAGLGMVCRQCKKLVKDEDYLLSCSKDNKASFKTILNNYGYLHHDDETHHYMRIRKSILG